MRIAIAACILGAACGGGGGGGAAPDAASGAVGTITVRVGADLSSWQIVADDEGGKQVVPLAAGGETQLVIHAGATVTGVVGGFSAYTITDVEPGDRLCLACGPTAVTQRIGIVAKASPYPTAVHYWFDLGAGPDGRDNADAPTAPLACPAPCAGPRDVVAYAADPRYLAWAAAPAQTLAANQTIELGPWHPMATFTAIYDGLANVREIDMDHAESSTNAPVVLDGDRTVSQSAGGATATASVASTDFGAFMTVSSTFLTFDDRYQTWIDVAPKALTYRVDASTQLLPWISDVAFDPRTRTISWSASSGLPPDGVWASVEWTYPPLTGDQPAWSWAILVRPGAGRAVLPSLPAGLLRDPADGDAVVEAVEAEMFEHADVESWAEMRSLADRSSPRRTSDARR